MLDTNTISYLMREHPAVERHVRGTPIPSLCISVITVGELMYGLVRRPEAVRLRTAITEFFLRVEVLPWTASTAERYGTVRAELEGSGKPLAPLDLLIAAHALDAGAILVTSDKAFAGVPDLVVQDWTH
jgi:tRNA(fMet)-specific endonuclease VapC